MFIALLLLTICWACSPGTEPVNENCVPCPLGTYSPTGEQCLICSPGRFANETGLAQCFLCPVNTFSDSFESAMCTPCPPGTFAPAEGSVECQGIQPNSSPALFQLSLITLFLLKLFQ